MAIYDVEITSITAANAIPMIVGGETQTAPVPMYVNETTSPVLFTWPSGGAPFQSDSIVMKVTVNFPALSRDTSLTLVGNTTGVIFASTEMAPAGATSHTFSPGCNPDNRSVISGTLLMCGLIDWQLQGLEYANIPLARIPLEIYYSLATGVPSPPAVETLRFNLAKSLVAKYLPENPTAPQTAAACTQAVWNNWPVYGTPPKVSAPHYYVGGWGSGDNFELTDWLLNSFGLTPNPLPSDCGDTAHMVCLQLELQQNPAIQDIFAAYLKPVYNTNTAYWRGCPVEVGPVNFGYHFVAVYTYQNGNETLTGVCDAAIGPHLGTESPTAYFDAAFAANPVMPPQPWGDPTEPSSRDWPAKVDGQPFPFNAAPAVRPPAPDAERHAFATRLGFTPSTAKAAHPLSSRSVDPSASPQLTSLGMKFQYFTPGTPISRRYMSFGDSSTHAHVKIWESSKGVKDAQDRFLDEGAATMQAIPLNALSQLGDAAANGAWDGGTECLWVYRNLAIRVTVFGHGADATEIARALQRKIAIAVA